MTWIVGVFFGHGEIRIFGEGLGGDQMGGTIHAAMGLAIIPVASYSILALKHIKRDAKLLQVFGGGDARGTRANNAILARTIRSGHSAPPLRGPGFAAVRSQVDFALFYHAV